MERAFRRHGAVPEERTATTSDAAAAPRRRRQPRPGCRPPRCRWRRRSRDRIGDVHRAAEPIARAVSRPISSANIPQRVEALRDAVAVAAVRRGDDVVVAEGSTRRPRRPPARSTRGRSPGSRRRDTAWPPATRSHGSAASGGEARGGPPPSTSLRCRSKTRRVLY